MKVRMALAATIVALTPVLVPASASAQIVERKDATGDVRSINEDNHEPGDPGTVVPDWADGDITSIRVNHLPRKVLVSMTFRELEKEKFVSGGLYVPAFGFRFRTSRMVRSVRLTDDAIVMRNGAGKNVSCAMSGRVDYENDFVVLRVPRRCLGTPLWVRVGGGSVLADGIYSLTDDARSSDGSAGPHYGPRVYR